MSPEDNDSDGMRRKTRKGTRSCWECKRRKVRCIYPSPAATVCTGCARRCLKCVSQEFPEQRTTSTARTRLVGDRIGRVEAMVQQLVKQSATPSTTGPEPLPSKSNGETMRCFDMPTPATSEVAVPTSCTGSTYPASSSVDSTMLDRLPQDPLSAASLGLCREMEFQPTALVATQIGPEYEKISEALLAAFPSQEDIDSFVSTCGCISVSFFQMLARPYRSFQTDGIAELSKLRIRHGSKTHPVLIARQMLMLATAMQYTTIDRREHAIDLTEPVHAMMKRLAETAIRLVSSNDGLLGTIEGLECIILEGLYQSNIGNLRRSWLAWRRSIGVAQLMCLHRQSQNAVRSLQSNYVVDPQFLWYRLIYVDRFMSLMLGLPQMSLDVSMASESALRRDTLMGQFERRLCVVSCRVLERNERDPSADDFTYTQKVDEDLQNAASIMPSKWWLAPNLAATQDDEQLFHEVSRLFSQMYYYNLLNQLHLPYMLHSSYGPGARRYDYSRITCVNASRELLSRYIMFRSYNKVAHCCRIVDFFALLASLTLLLAHLDGHRTAKRSDNILAHQRLSDRAMMEQVLENMETLGSLNEDLLSNKSAGLLHQLLAIEADAAKGSDYSLDTGSATNVDCGTLRLWVPYVGQISIARGGVITKENQPPSSSQEQRDSSQEAPPFNRPEGLGRYGVPGSGVLPPAPDAFGVTIGSAPTDQQAEKRTPSGSSEQPSSLGVRGPEPGLSWPNDGSITPQSLYPGLTASSEQWAFQGIDMAFFNNLMRETSTQPENGGSDGWVWASTT